jgi:hypothetical protein
MWRAPERDVGDGVLLGHVSVRRIVDPVVSKPFTEGLAIRPFKPKIHYRIAVLSPTHKAPSQMAQDFAKLLRRALRA